MADDVDLLELQPLNPSGDYTRVPGKLVARVGTLGLTVAWKVKHEHDPIACKFWRNAAPRKMSVVETMQKHDRSVTARNAQFEPVEADPVKRPEEVARVDP
jgi:hypothetical protein